MTPVPRLGPTGAWPRAWRWLWIWTALFGLPLPAAGGVESVGLRAGTGSVELGPALQYLEDPSGQLTLGEVRSPVHRAAFRSAGGRTAGFGFSPSAYWLRVAISNLDSDQARWLIELQYPLLDRIDFYLLEAGRTVAHQVSGDRIAFADRPMAQRTFVFAAEIPRGATRELFLRVASTSSLRLPVVLWSERAFQQADRDRQILFGGYYGIILAMLFFNAMLFARLRDAVYLYYVGYISCFALFQAGLNGLAYEYLWPGAPVWSERATPFFLAAASLLAIQFSRALLGLPRCLPAADPWLKGFMGLLAVLAAAALWAPYEAMIKLATACGLITSLALNLVGWIAWRARARFAGYYVVAWTAFLLGASIYALKSYALLPESFFTEYAIQIGSALGVLMLSFALACRVKLLEADNKRIQSEANQRLEQRVQERTEALNGVLHELAQANARLQMLSQTDALTGVYNRNYFDVHYQRLWASAQRGRGSIAVLMIDIDRFKRINDSHGHLCGDRVLVRVAEAIGDALRRSNDLLARYGGEEFVVVLSHTDLAGCLVVAERIRCAVSAILVPWEQGAVSPRVSIGLALAAPGRGDLARDLIASADGALYRAKAGGRDRVEVARPPAPSTLQAS